jgi:hypothetical protein
MDYTELNSILNNLELKYVATPVPPVPPVPPADTGMNGSRMNEGIPDLNSGGASQQGSKMNGSPPPSTKSMKDETNRRLTEYNQQFNVKSSQEMVNTAGRYDFKSFMDTEYKMPNENMDLNDRLSQRGMFMPNNAAEGNSVNRVFENLPIMTREIKKKK